MDDLENFRTDTRSWLLENCPPSLVGAPFSELDGTWGGKRSSFANPALKTWLEVRGAKGWTAPAWPSGYGGGGLRGEEAKVLAQEMASLTLPPALVLAPAPERGDHRFAVFGPMPELGLTA